MNNVVSDLLDIPTTELFDGIKELSGVSRWEDKKEIQQIEIRFPEAVLLLRPLSGGVLSVELKLKQSKKDRPVPSRPRESWGIINPLQAAAYSVSEDQQYIRLSWEDRILEIEKNSGAFSMKDHRGHSLFSNPNNPFRCSESLLAASFSTEETDRFYGLGEKSGTFNRRGRSFEMWNTDEPRHTPGRDPLYVSIPLLYRSQAKRCTSLFLDEPGRCWFDLADREPDRYTVAVPLSSLRFYLWAASNPAEAFRPYSTMTGKPPVPPLWALGFHQSRYSYFSDNEVKEIAKGFRSKKIPCDVIHLDIDYMDRYRVFTWNPKSFSKPKELCNELSDQGIKLVTIIDPGVGEADDYRIFREGKEGQHFICDGNGSKKPYIGAVWPGHAAYPDFTSKDTREWWKKEVKQHMDSGIAGIWNDMNEPADFTGDPNNRVEFTLPERCTVHPRGIKEHAVPFRELHNVYGQGMCMATRSALEEKLVDKRPFVLSRSGYAGIQRYAAIWTGDNNSWWEHMAMSISMLMGLSISGVPFVGADAGGFQGNADGELYARWLAYAAFTPFFRAHSATGTRPHEPWSFGKEIEAIAKKAIERRYRYLPYIYNQFHHSCESGEPIIRPLFWEYPNDSRAALIQDQYLFGPDLLIAPVAQAGVEARAVYLPKGCWTDVESGARYQGEQYILSEAPLERIPFFAREGAVIPSCPVAQHTSDAFWDKMVLNIYLPNGFKPERREKTDRIVEDDGISIKPEQSGRREIIVRQNYDQEGLTLKIENGGDREALDLVIHDAGGSRKEVLVLNQGSGQARVIFS